MGQCLLTGSYRHFYTIDSSRLLYSKSYAAATVTYTATENCIVVTNVMSGSSTGTQVYINDIKIGESPSGTNAIGTLSFPLAKGDTLKIVQGSDRTSYLYI